MVTMMTTEMSNAICNLDKQDDYNDDCLDN